MVYFPEHRRFEIKNIVHRKLWDHRNTATPQHRNTATPQHRNTAIPAVLYHNTASKKESTPQTPMPPSLRDDLLEAEQHQFHVCYCPLESQLLLKHQSGPGFSHSMDHTNGVSFLVRARIGSSVPARSGMNLHMYCTMPQKRFTLATSVGAGMLRIAFTLA